MVTLQHSLRNRSSPLTPNGGSLVVRQRSRCHVNVVSGDPQALSGSDEQMHLVRGNQAFRDYLFYHSTDGAVDLNSVAEPKWKHKFIFGVSDVVTDDLGVTRGLRCCHFCQDG